MRRPLKYILITAFAFVIALLGMDRMPQLIAVVGLALAGIYFITRKVEKNMRTKILTLFLLAFLLHVLISLFLYNETVDTKFYGFSYKGDDYTYGDFGTIVGDLWREGKFFPIKKLSYFNLIGGAREDVQRYQLYSAFIFYLFGTCGGQILLILNCFFYAVIIIPVYFLCKDLNIRNEVTTLVLSLFLLWPSTFFWSLFNFKEPMLVLALILAFYLCMKIRKSPNLRNVLFLLLSLLVVYFTKRFLAIIFPAIIFYFVALWKWRYKNFVILVSLIALILLQVFKGPFLSNLYVQLEQIPAMLSQVRYSSSFTNTGYLWTLSTSTHATTILYFPLGFLAALLLPFLALPASTLHIAANIESIIWWCLLPFLVSGMWISIKAEFKKTFIPLFTFLCWLSILGLTQANMGTLIRQKCIIYYIGFIFIGLGIDRMLRKVDGGKDAG
ncbi:MAG: hypothetical protein HQ549_01550 [Candidatus Omnitrophica bacterium]|nr:hypothetical protein [Candidatus Omnitrophota bacterium]